MEQKPYSAPVQPDGECLLAVTLLDNHACCLHLVPGAEPGQAVPIILPEAVIPLNTSELPPPSFWHKLCSASGLPVPGPLLFCVEEHREPAAPFMTGSLCRALDNGAPVAAKTLLGLHSCPAMLRLFAIRRMTGYPVVEYSAAFVLGMLSQRDVAERSWREGVTLLALEKDRVYGVLVFQEQVHAYMELSLTALFPETRGTLAAAPGDVKRFIALLEDFRLGWLPGERAAALGGHVCRPAALPAEAEGFKPIVASGPYADILRGTARVLRTAQDRLLCQGLLFGYRLLRTDSLEG